MNKRAKLIQVSVRAGVFSSEREVSFAAGSKNYRMLVDRADVQPSNRIRVYVVTEAKNTALVELPRETFTTGNRVRVPKSVLLDA